MKTQLPENHAELYWRPSKTAIKDDSRVLILTDYHGVYTIAGNLIKDSDRWMPLPQEPEESR